MRFTILASLAPLLPLTSAHGGALNYTVGETWYPGYNPYSDDPTQDNAPNIVQRKWASNDPIFSPTDPSLSCNNPGTPAMASIPLLAGQNITAAYGPWLHTVGPMVAWMAYCSNTANDCGTFPLGNALWFKIGERGLLSGSIQTGVWFQGTFSRWDGEPSLWEEHVPSTLRAGRYLIRHEIVYNIPGPPVWRG
ncbi:glycoside hydrolase family 61 protein-like protein [Stemphylium lycopersici]|nr:glycoside hydrolase family 61 protein [Stemphylium lycopersici]RAR03477.1 glycoside hydrolase family 61 protein-like protein [Stemphylium lycopersici]